MSKQAVHSLVVRFNKLPEGSLEKDRIRLIIQREMENFLKSVNPVFAIS